MANTTIPPDFDGCIRPEMRLTSGIGKDNRFYINQNNSAVSVEGFNRSCASDGQGTAYSVTRRDGGKYKHSNLRVANENIGSHRMGK